MFTEIYNQQYDQQSQPPESPMGAVPSRMSRESTESSKGAAYRFSFVSSGSVDRTQWSSSRVKVMAVIESKTFDVVMGILIMGNLGLIVMETNMNASCEGSSDTTCGVPVVVTVLNLVLLFIYTVEALCRFYAYRSYYFKMPWNLLDMVIVLSGIIDLTLSNTSNVPNLQTLRVFRILRLLRTVRLLSIFPELYEMVRGLSSAMRAIFWGVIMIVLMLAIWSLLAVEIIHPRNDVAHAEPWCYDAFSSVEKATLYFFQTLVAGDSWGTCAVPIVKESPAVIVIFAGALVSVQLGFTNLILAVIVETAAQARERDYERRLRDKKVYEKECLEEWHNVIESLDKDQSGSISMEELKAGFRDQKAVGKILELLDIDESDLEQLFRLMDNDQSGDVSYVEFFHCLRKAHSQDMRMYLMNVKLQISQISTLMSKQMEAMEEGFKSLGGSQFKPPTRLIRPAAVATSATIETVSRTPDSSEGVANENNVLVCDALVLRAAANHDAAKTVRYVPMRSGNLESRRMASKGKGSASEAENCPRDVYSSEAEVGLKASLDSLRSELEARLDELARAATKNAKTLDTLLALNNPPLSENASGSSTPMSGWQSKTRETSKRRNNRVMSLKKALTSMGSEGASS